MPLNLKLITSVCTAAGVLLTAAIASFPGLPLSCCGHNINKRQQKMKKMKRGSKERNKRTVKKKEGLVGEIT